MPSGAYATAPGWATITALREPDPHSYSIGDAVEIVFDFEPDERHDPAGWEGTAGDAGEDRGQVLTIGAGANPPRRWAERRGLLPGTRHRCLRRTLRRGVGPPVLFEFPDIDDAAVMAAFEEGGP